MEVKMPQRMKLVHEQILTHPEYKTKLNDSTRYAFETGCIGGYSWKVKENNKWSRQIWKYLHWNETSPGLGEPQPECLIM